MTLTRIIEIENNLANILVKSWQSVFQSYMTRLLVALKAGNEDAARKIVSNFSLDTMLDGLDKTLNAYSSMAFRFGTQQAATTPSSVNDMHDNSIELFKAMVTQNVAEQVKKASLKVISDFNKVKKADDSILHEFKSFADKVTTTAERNLRMATTLHTNRLASYGATAEMNLLGIKEYTINGQLDKKICPVCRVQHGRIFQVSDARNLLQKVLKTKDPDKLKELQPWPNVKQAARMSIMKPADLVTNGWHIPPYHGNCRCLIIKIEDVPALSMEAKPSSIASGANKLRYEPNQWDFIASGLEASQANLEAWKKALGVSPMQLLGKLFGEPAGLMTRDFLDTRGLKATLTDKELSFDVNNVLFGSKNPVTFKGGIDLLNKTGGLDILNVAEEDAGLAGEILDSAVEGFKQAGLDAVALNANVGNGSYAMAKYGFVPRDTTEWGRLKKISIAPKWKAVKKKLPPKVVNVIDNILSSDDPQAIWDLADITFKTEKGALGEYLLKDTQWWAKLDLNDQHSMARFDNYFKDEPVQVW